MKNDVYIFNTTKFFGGGELFQIRLAALLRHHIRLVVVSPPVPSLRSGLAESGAGFIELPARSGLALRWAFLRWLWHQRSAIHASRALIVLNGRGAAYLAPFVRLFSGAAPVIIFHTALSMQSVDIKEWLYGQAARFARCVVAVSDSVAAQHNQRWPDLAVMSIPNWIDLCESSLAGASHNFSSVAETLLVVVVARLAEGKGVEDVVAACRDEEGIELHIYGDGPMRDQLHNMSSQSTWLHFCGHVDDLPRRLPTYSILISGSYSESCSYAVAEGIQAGLLCVVTDIPAHKEMLGANYPNELFFPPGDKAALKKALQVARGLLSKDQGDGARRAVSGALGRIATRNSPEAARLRYLAVLSAADIGDSVV